MTSICTGYISSPSSSTAPRSTPSYPRRSEPKSQFGPVNSGASALVGAASSLLSTHAPFCEQFVEHREDLGRVADPPHCEMRVRRCDLVIGAPQIAVARQPGQAASQTVSHFNIGEVL